MTFSIKHKPWNKGLHVATNNVFCKGNILGVANKGKPKSKLHKKKLRIAHLGKKASDKTKKIMSEQRSGENGYQWIKDRSLLKRFNDTAKDRGSYAHIEWSKRVKKRDKYCCKINNQDCKGRLESHHILGWHDYPELRYDINNGITLCHFHHPRKRVDEQKLIPIFKNIVETATNFCPT